MKVKQGYKYTEEFGYIPEDWEIKKLGELGETIIGLTYSPKEISKIGLLVLRSSNIQNDKLFFEDNVFVKKEIPNKLYTRYGDILICVRNGSRDLIGKCAFINEKGINQTFGAFMTVFRIANCPYFIFSLFRSSIIKEQIKIGIGATINQITNYVMRNFILPLPPIQEQEKIAQVLRDMDKLIESIEALLEKKRNLKIATMQKLLTPQPHWEEKKLKDIVGVITTGKLDANAMDKNGIYRFYTCAKEFYWINKYAFEGNAILISGNGANVGYIHYYSGKFNAYQRTYVLQQFYCNDKLLKFFLDKNLSLRIEEELNSSNTPFIKKTTLVDMVIFLPPIQEQQKIAQILSNMDEEIDALEKELEKYRLLKTGTMQELLTGKTRLL